MVEATINRAGAASTDITVPITKVTISVDGGDPIDGLERAIHLIKDLQDAGMTLVELSGSVTARVEAKMAPEDEDA